MLVGIGSFFLDEIPMLTLPRSVTAGWRLSNRTPSRCCKNRWQPARMSASARADERRNVEPMRGHERP
jgi:hypothetical protein